MARVEMGLKDWSFVEKGFFSFGSQTGKMTFLGGVLRLENGVRVVSEGRFWKKPDCHGLKSMIVLLGGPSLTGKV